MFVYIYISRGRDGCALHYNPRDMTAVRLSRYKGVIFIRPAGFVALVCFDVHLYDVFLIEHFIYMYIH